MKVNLAQIARFSPLVVPGKEYGQQRGVFYTIFADQLIYRESTEVFLHSSFSRRQFWRLCSLCSKCSVRFRSKAAERGTEFFGFRSIFRAAKTKISFLVVRRSFFAPKPHGNAC